MLSIFLIGLLFVALLVSFSLSALYASRAPREKSNPLHPPKADTHPCKYDRAVERRTSLLPRPKVDLSNLPAKDARVVAAYSGVNRDRVVENLRKFCGELPVTVTKDGKQTTGSIVSRSSYSEILYDLGMPWVEEQFKALGLVTKHHAYSKESYNLIATIPGDGSSKKRIVLGAHGDATAGETWRKEKKTSGADDDAAGVMLLLEVARAMRNLKPKYDIEFVIFTMEEQGLEGSYAYSDKLKREGVELVTMIQFDMPGYHANEGNRMDVHDGGNANGSHSIYEVVARACAQYELDLTPFDTHNDEMNRRSDHAGFLDHGYKALMFSEEFTDVAFNPNYHTLKDTVDKLNIPYYLEIIKLAIASVFNLSEIH